MLGIAGRYSAIGLEMVIAIAVGLFFGNWLDGRFGTGPWLTILFGLFGTAAAFKGILRHIKGIDIDRL
jgi:F0F1-type ATP synthase assembly protein I